MRGHSRPEVGSSSSVRPVACLLDGLAPDVGPSALKPAAAVGGDREIPSPGVEIVDEVTGLPLVRDVHHVLQFVRILALGNRIAGEVAEHCTVLAFGRGRPGHHRG